MNRAGRMLALAAVAFAAQAQIWNQNLIFNGDAEAGPGIAACEKGDLPPVPGWTVSGLTVAQYMGACDEFVGDGYGPFDRGNNYFIGGYDPGSAKALQTIDLSAGAAEIDAGRVRFYLSAYLGIGPDRDKLIQLKATFKDAKGNVLLVATVNGPTFNESYYLTPHGTSGFLLPNTRSVDILLDLTNAGAANTYDQLNNTPADNLSLVLTKEPVIGANLIANGDAEMPDTNDGHVSSRQDVAAWNTYQTSSGICAEDYDLAGIALTAPQPPTRGHLFFSCGGSNTLHIFQLTDITLAKDSIDTGNVNFHFSGWLGAAWGSDPAQGASAEVDFLDAKGNVLGSSTIGPVGPTDLQNVTGLLQRTADGVVPPGTRSVRSFLLFDQIWGVALADDLSLVLGSSGAPVTLNGVYNGASSANGAVAPGEVVNLSVSGVNLDVATDMQVDSDGLISTELDGVIVYFDGTKAPLIKVKSSQITAVAPFELDGATSTTVRVQYRGVDSNSLKLDVAPAAPGIFNVLDSHFQVVSASNPAAVGSMVTIMFTGAGQTNPPGIDGQIEYGSQAQPTQPVSVTIDGQKAQVVYAGTVPLSWDGMMMAQVQVPSGVTTSSPVPVVLSVGGISSPAKAVNMWVK